MNQRIYQRKKVRTITVCSSASFYKAALTVKRNLEARGFKVLLPHNAAVMERAGDYRVSSYKTWRKNPQNYKRKTWLMKKHFREIEKSNAILVVNLKKKGIKGYIGGNVLLEMGLAFYLNKPIYILSPVSKVLPLYEEVLGMSPTFLDGDLTKIK